MYKKGIKKGKSVLTNDSKNEFKYVYENLAKLDSLVSYLGKDFIDWDCVKEINERREHYLKYEMKINQKKNNPHTFYPPYKCKKCNNAWSQWVTGEIRNLPKEVFEEIVLEYKDCGLCDA